jgi:hypothetical protein
MRRIILSLFAISTIVGVGVFATGAYFTDTVTQDNYTFTTGSADLKIAFCTGGVGADCSGVHGTLDTVTFTDPQTTGPGITADDCLVIENTGEYALTLSSQLFVTYQSNTDMDNFFEVETDQANTSCQATGTLRGWASAQDAAAAGQVASGITLAPDARLWIITRNRWNSTGDQNYLQNGSIVLKSVIEGRTV